MSYTYKGRINSDIEEIASVVLNIIKKLNTIETDENLLFDIRIIMNELLINGCEHGNCYDQKKKIDLAVLINERKIRIQVNDQGDGVKYQLVDYRPESFCSSGRGLRIVEKLSDELIIQNNSVTAIINK